MIDQRKKAEKQEQVDQEEERKQHRKTVFNTHTPVGKSTCLIIDMGVSTDLTLPIKKIIKKQEKVSAFGLLCRKLHTQEMVLLM